MENIIIGSKGSKGGGGGGRVAQEAPNSLKSKAYVKIVEVLGEGEWEGIVNGAQGIYLDGVPLQNPDGTYNFNDVYFEERKGTLDQPITKIGSSTEVTNTVGTEIKKAAPVEYTITDSNVDAARVSIQVPSLQQQNTSNGDISGTTVRLLVEYKPNGGTFIQPSIGSTETVLNGFNGITGYDRLTGELNLQSNFTVVDVPSEKGKRTSKKYTPLTYSLEYSTNGGANWSVIKTGTGIFAPEGVRASERQIVPFSFDADKALTYSFRLTTSGGTGSIANFKGSKASGEVVITGKTNSPYERDVQFDLTGSAPWIIRVTRITEDSTVSSLSNKTYLSSVTAIFKEKFSYPATAYVAISVDAEQFSNIPERSYDVKMTRVNVPVNYDPIARTYTGVWNGTFKKAWTDNPAWCYYDLLTNKRYGLGDRIDASKINKWELYKIAKYCDELVDDGTGVAEPRFTCNLLIQSREEAYKVIQDMSSVFAGISYWGSTRDGFSGIIPVQDAPTPTVSYLYNNSNVVDGVFEYKTGNINTRYNVVYVSYNDPDDGYKQKVLYVPDTEAIKKDGYINSTEVVAFGCTSKGQAYRLGRRILFANRYENEVVSFSVGADGVVATIGSVIGIGDELKAGTRIGGRLVSQLSSTQVKLDNPVAIESGKTYKISFIDSDGSVVERNIATTASTTDTISFTPAITNALAQNSIYVISSNTLNYALYKVVSSSETEEGYAITAVKYNASKYGYVDSMDSVTFLPTTGGSVVPSPPSSLTVTDTIYIDVANNIATRVDLSWKAPASSNAVKGYSVEYRVGSENNWIKLEDTSYPAASLYNAVDGATYYFRVWAINALGTYSAKALEGSYVPVGKAKPPSDVTGLNSRVDSANGIILSWANIPDVDLDEYEIRRGTTWESSNIVASVKGTSFNVGFSGGKYFVKAKDTSKVYSTNAATITVSPAAPSTPVVSSAFESNIVRITWTVPTSDYLIDSYEVMVEGLPARTVKGTTLNIEVVWSGVKKITVRALDIAGNYSQAGSVSVSVNVPTKPSITQEVIDNNVLLRWTDSKTTLPITSYEIRRGSVWDSATVVGKVQAQFSAIFESNGGTFTYLIKAYDTAGNESAIGSVVAVVNQPPDYVLQLSVDTTFAGAGINSFRENGALLIPVNTTETWQTHFTSRGWNSPQDQINAGFPIFIQPSNGSGYYEEIIDYGSVLAGTKVSVTPAVTILAGNPTYTIDISVRKTLTDAWTVYNNYTSVYATDFRYVKYRLTVNTDSADDLMRIDNINVKLDSKLKNDAGFATVSASDVGGTVINFNIPFVDIQSITVTPQSTTPVIAVYDFRDIPNPTSFKVLLYNQSGTRVSGNISWSAKGV